MSQARDPTMLIQVKYGLVPDQLRYPTTVRGVPIPGADDRLQQQKLGSGIPKSAQSSEAVEHDSEGARKDGSTGEGPGINVQGGGTVGDVIC